MIKQKVYELAGTNAENLGSDLERNIKEASADTEEAWKVVDGQPGLKIWRIEMFQVKPWPEHNYGSFYSGDSYIVLNTYLDDDGAVGYDVHFWLGEETTQDEAGTAAYKTVELDTYLGDKPIQHREVEGFESKLFHSYFPDGIVTLEGGIDSGFFHVTPEQYAPRLLRVKGVFKNVRVKQVPLSRDSLNSGDVFILDFGQKIYQFNGNDAGAFEKHRASEVVSRIKERRGFSIDLVVIDQDSPTTDDDEFWSAIGGKGEIPPPTEPDSIESRRTDLLLFRLSDRTGELKFEKIAEGKDITPDMFDSDDVFLLDRGYIIYIWVGGGASKQEKRSGMRYATKYIQENHGGLPLPITVIPESGDKRVVAKLLSG